jgi:hypothetical protein
MENTDQPNVAGVFRDHAKADHAIDELKQAGFREDQLKLALYSPQRAEDSRFIVTVRAGDRQQDAVGILFSYGANNADLPPGTILEHGSIIGSQGETTDLIPEQTAGSDFTVHSFFAEEHVPGHPDEIEIIDNPNAPHG